MTSVERDLDYASGLVHALLDLTDLGAPLGIAEIAARRAQAFELFDQSPQPAAVFAASVQLPRLANRAWRALFGRRVLPTSVRGTIDVVRRTGTAVHLGEVPLELVPQIDHVAVSLRPLRGAQGVATATIVVCAVLTDEHEARAELLAQAVAARADAERANRLKDQFLATVSHELRAPLTTMILWEKVLGDDTLDAATHAQARMAIRDSAVAQSRLVGDLLDVARAISGKLYIDMRTLDIAQVVRDAIGAAEPAACAKGVAISHRGALVALDLHGDATRLRQVLDNLLSNAVKFTDGGGAVTVALERTAGRVRIVVEDNGRGIPPEFMGRLFEPFSQCDDVLTRRGGGLGLGLAISRQLVELHDGTLVAASDGAGQGARLTLSLPDAAARVPSPATSTPTQMRLEHCAILVVDDDHRVREALALLLDRAGAVVQTADSAASARASIATVTPDLVVCDIAMPDEDGYSFIRKLRATGNALPAIALTAHAMEADIARALAAGFDMHLAKPIDFDRLVAKIDELIAARAA